jgi:hypothetical protein
VSLEGVATDLEKLNTVWEWPPPTDKHELRIFFGLCTCYQRFTASFVDNIVYRKSPRIPQAGEKLIIDTYASNMGTGGALSEMQESQECVVLL